MTRTLWQGRGFTFFGKGTNLFVISRCEFGVLQKLLVYECVTCFYCLLAPQGNKINSQSVPRPSSFSATTIFRNSNGPIKAGAISAIAAWCSAGRVPVCCAGGRGLNVQFKSSRLRTINRRPRLPHPQCYMVSRGH